MFVDLKSNLPFRPIAINTDNVLCIKIRDKVTNPPSNTEFVYQIVAILKDGNELILNARTDLEDAKIQYERFLNELNSAIINCGKENKK